MNSLSRGELGIDEDYIKNLYPTKGDDELTDLFSLLMSRATLYNEIYPFIVDYDNKRLILKSDLSDTNKLYIFFLLCSTNEKVIRSGNILESDFEHISTLVLKQYLPSTASVYHFGKSSYQEARYTGKLTDKMDKLAEDIKCETAYDVTDFSSKDTGDGGLDIIAWVPFPDDDNFMHIQVFLGQCAIGKDWINKHNDVEKMKNNIHFPLGTVSMMYVPHDLRKDNGKFKKSSSRAQLLFDRFRLVKFINEELMEIIKTTSTFTELISKIIPGEVDILDI